uniref:Uncharacterized protein n=1 Tax=Strombidium inclinatum TaxID=197538 RepID=A0A7S3MZS5_9SPIT|mmetsp:Transcript_33503/g.51463  ORF Transcript_33503/g.51463 Transcript_33503/m.51463 type:complete len:180 (+) Transcript_33503:1537-2076(+)
MGLVVYISNNLEAYSATVNPDESDTVVKDHLAKHQEVWAAFSETELREANENNSKVLGQSFDEEEEFESEEEEDEEENMADFMIRFKGFGRKLENDDDEEEDEPAVEEDDEDDDIFERAMSEASTCSSTEQLPPLKVEKVALPSDEPLNPKFMDNQFWNTKLADESVDLDSLLASLDEE